ncbi:MAG: hypothetical protein ABFS16_06940 [Bacteroidota bacterium]
MKKDKIWIVVQLAIVVIAVLIFTPLIIPEGQSSPELFGLPYTLWTGIIVYFILVTLNFIGARSHAKKYDDGND